MLITVQAGWEPLSRLEQPALHFNINQGDRRKDQDWAVICIQRKIQEFLDCLYRDTSLGPPHVRDVMLISHDHMCQPESIIHCVDQSDDFVDRALFSVECNQM